VPKEVSVPVSDRDPGDYNLHLHLHRAVAAGEPTPLEQRDDSVLPNRVQPHLHPAAVVDGADHPDRPRQSPHPVGTFFAMQGFGLQNPTRKYCLICHVYKPERTHHCSTCSRCVLNMDHHWYSHLHVVPGSTPASVSTTASSSSSCSSTPLSSLSSTFSSSSSPFLPSSPPSAPAILEPSSVQSSSSSQSSSTSSSSLPSYYSSNSTSNSSSTTKPLSKPSNSNAWAKIPNRSLQTIIWVSLL
jgi:hypothetical protein